MPKRIEPTPPPFPLRIVAEHWLTVASPLHHRQSTTAASSIRACGSAVLAMTVAAALSPPRCSSTKGPGTPRRRPLASRCFSQWCAVSFSSLLDVCGRSRCPPRGDGAVRRSLATRASSSQLRPLPRLVVAVTGDRRPGQARTGLADRPILNQPVANVIEVLSYNEDAGRSEFQEIVGIQATGTANHQAGVCTPATRAMHHLHPAIVERDQRQSCRRTTPCRIGHLLSWSCGGRVLKPWLSSTPRLMALQGLRSPTVVARRRADARAAPRCCSPRCGSG